MKLSEAAEATTYTATISNMGLQLGGTTMTNFSKIKKSLKFYQRMSENPTYVTDPNMLLSADTYSFKLDSGDNIKLKFTKLTANMTATIEVTFDHQLDPKEAHDLTAEVFFAVQEGAHDGKFGATNKDSKLINFEGDKLKQYDHGYLTDTGKSSITFLKAK